MIQNQQSDKGLQLACDDGQGSLVQSSRIDMSRYEPLPVSLGGEWVASAKHLFDPAMTHNLDFHAQVVEHHLAQADKEIESHQGLEASASHIAQMRNAKRLAEESLKSYQQRKTAVSLPGLWTRVEADKYVKYYNDGNIWIVALFKWHTRTIRFTGKMSGKLAGISSAVVTVAEEEVDMAWTLEIPAVILKVEQSLERVLSERQAPG